MNDDLIPLKDQHGAAAQVLRSADADEAPPHAMRRVAAALGVQASILALSATATAAEAASPAAGVGLAAVSKALLVGLGAGVLVSGGLLISDLAGPDDQPTWSPAVPSATAPRRVVPAKTEPLVAVASAAEPAPEVSKTHSAPAVATSRETQSPRAAEPAPNLAPEAPRLPSASPKVSPSIAQEVAELDRARALIATKQPGGAVAVLDGYGKNWPNGVLALEAAVLRVEAELARGHRAEAERQARALIAAHPNTGYARKVSSLLGLDEKL